MTLVLRLCYPGKEGDVGESPASSTKRHPWLLQPHWQCGRTWRMSALKAFLHQPWCLQHGSIAPAPPAQAGAISEGLTTDMQGDVFQGLASKNYF